MPRLGSKFHANVCAWLEDVLANEQVFFSWQTITGFLRIATSPSILTNPVPLEAAVQLVSEWLELENTHLVALEKKNWPLYAKILKDSQSTGNLVMDAHLAAMAASCGAAVASTDRDFGRFDSIQLINPVSKT